jgi:3-methyladenine DNA glycosylase AlkD
MAKQREQWELVRVMEELAALGSQQTRQTWINHGAEEPLFGVKIGDMKKLLKRLKEDHLLALVLYETGNADAMYFAALLCDPGQMKMATLEKWMSDARWYMLSEFAVAQVAADSGHGLVLAKKWLANETEHIAAGGWATLAALLSIRGRETTELAELRNLLAQVKEDLSAAQNRVRYAMNSFVIAVGSFVPELTDAAMQTGLSLGNVEVSMGNTACKVPPIVATLDKIRSKGYLGKLRREARC